MILDYFDSKLDGDSWEELCNSCYRIRYQDEHYTEIPATYKGDAGIEGFTRTGIVHQCYCPEKDYSDDDLYNHQRDKMTTDINKLLSNGDKLDKLGVPTIKEWHYVTPFYKDSRIVQHAETKRKEVLAKKKEKPDQYAYIADDFSIIIKIAEDFKLEITRIIRNSLTDIKLNLAIRNVEIPDWEKCDSDKTNNIIRKVKAISGTDDADALKMAKEALGGRLLLMEEDNDDFPIPTPLKDIPLEENERIALVEVFMPAIRLANVNKSVNRTVTLPAWLNSLALEKGVNFSHVLQDALKQHLTL